VHVSVTLGLQDSCAQTIGLGVTILQAWLDSKVPLDIAPEYGQGGQVSTQGDVYSYGVLLLEILTGKRPTDEISQDGMSLSLHNFVNSAFPDKIGMILDPIIVQEIMAGENQKIILAMQSCIVPLIKLGLLCSMESPKDRLPAEHISSEVHAIKNAFSNINGRG